ncbi:hypothetical protein ACSQ67_007146 [Phaseolus vulgaris]
MKNSDPSAHFESPHSPLRFRSSPLSDNGDPFHSPENSPLNDHRDNSRAIVIVETSTQSLQAAPPSPSLSTAILRPMNYRRSWSPAPRARRLARPALAPAGEPGRRRPLLL